MCTEIIFTVGCSITYMSSVAKCINELIEAAEHEWNDDISIALLFLKQAYARSKKQHKEQIHSKQNEGKNSGISQSKRHSTYFLICSRLTDVFIEQQEWKLALHYANKLQRQIRIKKPATKNIYPYLERQLGIIQFELQNLPEARRHLMLAYQISQTDSLFKDLFDVRFDSRYLAFIETKVT